MPSRFLQSVDWVGADVGELGVEVNIVEAEEGINLLLDVDNGHDGVSVLVVVSPGDGPVGLLLAEGGVEALGWGALLGQVAVGLLGAVVLVDLEGVVAGSDVGGLAGCCLLVFMSSRLIGGLGGFRTYSCEDPQQSRHRDQRLQPCRSQQRPQPSASPKSQQPGKVRCGQESQPSHQ